MKLERVAFDASLAEYETQARELLTGYQAGAEWAQTIFARTHPRFRDQKVAWLMRPLQPGEVQGAGLDLDDARTAVARGYDFRDWASLASYAETVRADPAVRAFEAAIEAVITGDLSELGLLLDARPDLVAARSQRVTCFDPPVHGAMLLHYVAANGIENYRQKTPPNAVAVARKLLVAGAEADALAWLYGGECTTMSLLVSSSHPAQAGVQVDLVETLLEFGASVLPRGSGTWVSPVRTALVFGFPAAAEKLVERGAGIESLAVAAGLGRLAEVEAMLAGAADVDLQQALALGAQLGRGEVVERLLQAGADPNRHNPEGFHSHATALHHAALAGHLNVVQRMVACGSRLDVRDTIYQATPLGWAEHAGHTEVVQYLQAAGAGTRPI